MARPPNLARPSTARPQSRGPSNPIKEPAHLPLHRRLLFSTYPLDKPLPPLVQGDGADIQILNERLYTLIALAFRAYILSWLPRITRDRSLLPQIHQNVLAPILSPLFARLQSDPDRLIPFILTHLPSILSLHIQTYWQARQAALLPLGIGEERLDGLYHARLPLLSTEPAPAPLSTPTVPPTTEVSSPAPLYELGEKAQPHSDQDQEKVDAEVEAPGTSPIPEGQYIISGLWLASLSDSIIKLYLPPEEYSVVVERVMIREIIGRTILGGVARRIIEPWFWWSLLLKFIPAPRTLPSLSSNPSSRSKSQTGAPWQDMIVDWFSRLWRVTSLLWTFGTWFFATLSVIPRGEGYQGSTTAWMALSRQILGIDGREGCGRRRWASRLVWGSLEMVVFLLSPVSDRLLPHLIRVHVLQPQLAIRLVDLLENILFPLDGYPAPTPLDPTPDEARVMRTELEERLSGVIPRIVRETLVPSHVDLRHLLDPISDSGCNAHMVAMVYTSVVGTLIPELVVGAGEVDQLGPGDTVDDSGAEGWEL